MVVVLGNPTCLTAAADAFCPLSVCKTQPTRTSLTSEGDILVRLRVAERTVESNSSGWVAARPPLRALVTGVRNAEAIIMSVGCFARIAGRPRGRGIAHLFLGVCRYRRFMV